MIPKSPVIEGRAADEVAVGEAQEQFQTLPTLFFRDPEGFHALSAWQFEDEAEREEFLRTGTIFVSQLMPEGDAPRPILPSVYPPDIPEQTPAADEGEARVRIEPVFFEFRMVALDRRTGDPVSGVAGGARVFLDLTTLSAQFPAAGASTENPTEIINRHLQTFARLLASSYGADVYCRLHAEGEESRGWLVTEGTLENGAHLSRKVHAANSGRLPSEIDVAVLDAGGANFAESAAMIRALQTDFAPPLYLVGFSPLESPADVSALGDVLASRPCASVAEAVSHFRETLRPAGDYCLLIRSEAYAAEGEPREGFFMLDTRIFEQSRSN